MYNLNSSMKSIHCFFALILIMTTSCGRYPSINFYKQALISSAKAENKDESNRLFNRLSLSPEGNESYPVSDKKKSILLSERRFSDPYSFNIVDELNHTGVKYALGGKLKEAEIIFTEVLYEDKQFAPALNNLALVFELMDNYDQAFSYYSAACLTDPGNQWFMQNFLLFCDTVSGSLISPFGKVYIK
jgi:tetratricopeptide (TPR) repeat protein